MGIGSWGGASGVDVESWLIFDMWVSWTIICLCYKLHQRLGQQYTHFQHHAALDWCWVVVDILGVGVGIESSGWLTLGLGAGWQLSGVGNECWHCSDMAKVVGQLLWSTEYQMKIKKLDRHSLL